MLEDDEVKRRQFAAGAAALAGLPVLERMDQLRRPVVPHQVGAAEIEQVRASSVDYAAWGRMRGGGSAHVAALPELECAAELLRKPCPTRLRSRLFTVVADLAATTGFALFDASEQVNARRVFRYGLACAEQGDDWNMRAQLLSHLGHQAVQLNDPEQALNYLEYAQAGWQFLVPTQRARLHTVRARALAKQGCAQDALRAVGMAEEEFSRARPAQGPEWLSHYSHPQLVAATGHALADLAIHGNRTDARPRLEQAIAAYTDRYARSRVLAQAHLAMLVMTTGDPREAAAIGQQAAGYARRVRSRRIRTHLAELRETAVPHLGIPEVADLREGIQALA